MPERFNTQTKNLGLVFEAVIVGIGYLVHTHLSETVGMIVMMVGGSAAGSNIASRFR